MVLPLNEFELIKAYFTQDSQDLSVLVGVGDDCAVLDVPVGQNLAISIDTLVEGVHFPSGAKASDIAQRALCVAVSDLAAMGAKPMWYTLALTLPNMDEDWLKGFSDGLAVASTELGVKLVGGDTTRGPLCISVQVHGLVREKGLTRDKAQDGDLVFVTGPLGDGAAALEAILSKPELNEKDNAYLHDRFYRPQPKLAEGMAIVGIASSAIDISDGLLADLGHIAKSSRLGANVNIEQLPFSNAAKRNFDQGSLVSWALSGGDDYQICFTVPPEKKFQLLDLAEKNRFSFYEIGAMTLSKEVCCLEHGKPFESAAKGFQHF